MILYIIRRVLWSIPVMFVVALFVFSLLYLAPGDPAAVIAGDQASPADVEKIRVSLGLDKPYLWRFGIWLSQILQGDLGVSIFSQLPVSELILQRIEPTLSLMLFALLITVVVGIPMGLLAAWNKGGVIDRLVMGFAVLGFSIPIFVFGYLLAYVFGSVFRLVPVQGFVPISSGIGPFLKTIILPSIALSTVYIALVARITRTSMLEIISQDYMRTARAKGLSPFAMVVSHALKNAAIPIITVLGVGFATLLGGAVVTETVFSVPGLGRLTVDAILRRDYPVIQGVILLSSLFYVLVNLAVDITYMIVDPRIRL